MQSAPFVHWFEGEEEFKQLARVFYLHPCACARGSPARPGPGPAALGGAHGEYLYSARLDNLASCFVSTEALVSHATEHLAEDAEVSLVALFDHEEVGSASATGAFKTWKTLLPPRPGCDDRWRC